MYSSSVCIALYLIALIADNETMLTLKVTDELNKLIAGLKGFSQQELMAITIKTINASAYDAKYAITRELKSIIKNPTPFTEKAVRVINAKPSRLFADVGFLDSAGKGTAPSDYLNPLVEGGPRKQKRTEKRLKLILANGETTFLTPGPSARLNKYGNVPASKYVEVLSYFKLFNETGITMNRSKNSTAKKKIANKFFMVIPGVDKTAHLSPGIYERRGRGFLKIFNFAKQPTYSKTYDFYKVGIEYAAQSFVKNFNYQVQYVYDKIRNGI